MVVPFKEAGTTLAGGGLRDQISIDQFRYIKLLGGVVFIFYILSGVLRPKRRQCGIYLGISAEFATKGGVCDQNKCSFPPQDDLSKLVYSFFFPVARVWEALTQEVRVPEGRR